MNNGLKDPSGSLPKSNIILIGMPGSGKSTLGSILAKRLGMTLIDTDHVIKEREKRPLQDLIDQYGLRIFIQKESAAILSIHPEHCVIATGGSVVLDFDAMQHLRSLGWIVYLDVPLPKLERRLWNIKTRGIVIKKGQTIRDVYRLRKPLYERYADIIQQTISLSAEQIVDQLIAKLRALH
jgi:shikimate kinase